MLKALDVAAYIIDFCNNHSCGFHNKYFKYVISNLYLQKLLYFLQVEYLVSKQNNNNISSLISEPCEAWALGPVYPDVYETYKSYGGSHIEKVLPSLVSISKGKPKLNSYNNFNKNDKDFITYGLQGNNSKKGLLSYSPSKLVYISHCEPQWKSKHVLAYDKQQYDNKKSLNYFIHNKFWIK